MAGAAEVSAQADGWLPAAAPGVDLAGLRALAQGRAQLRRRAATDPAPAPDDPEPVRPAAGALFEPFATWC
jgi:hypothetical protein